MASSFTTETVAELVGVLTVTVSAMVAISYIIDRRAHEGVDYFKRSSVRKNGIDASATVLSETILPTGTGGKHSAAYSIVYEVQPSNGAPSFRARAIETLRFSEAHANNIRAGAVVNVRFDPTTNLVVLMRVDRKSIQQNQDDARRAREAALLKK